MSQLAVCLAEFLAFLGIPYIRALQALVSAALDQLEVEKGLLLSRIAFTQSTSEAIDEAIGIAEYAADLVQNTLADLPLGVFQDCAPAANMLGALRGPFDGVLDYYDYALNEANRIRTFSDIQSILDTQIEEQITYLRNLNDQMDQIILGLLRQQAAKA